MTAPLPSQDHEAKLEAALDRYLLSTGLTDLERQSLWVAFLDAGQVREQTDLTTTD